MTYSVITTHSHTILIRQSWTVCVSVCTSVRTFVSVCGSVGHSAHYDIRHQLEATAGVVTVLASLIGRGVTNQTSRPHMTS